MKKIDLIIISYNRLAELKQALANVLNYKNSLNKIIVIDNNSEDGTGKWLKTIIDEKIEVILSDTNLGVARGRNLGIKKSTADILVFLDDDAIFTDTQKNPFKTIIDKFDYNNQLGIIAFKIVNFHSKSVQKHEFPFSNKNIDKNVARGCAYYVGAGHAIRRSVFKIAGLYPEDYFYGKEELDLSLRAINHNFILEYIPSIKIYHNPSLSGRMPNQEKWSHVYRNRLIISYKYYPLKYRLISNTLWFIKITLICRSIITPLNGISSYLKVKKTINKELLTKESISYIKNNYGRLYY